MEGVDETSSNHTRQTMTVEEAAAILGISRANAYECARTGELPSIRFGRRVLIPSAALSRLLQPGGAEEGASPRMSDAS